MPKNSIISVPVMLVVAVATPATIALSLFSLTNDHELRPLAISIEKLESSWSDDNIQTEVYLKGHYQDSALAKQMDKDIRLGFRAKGEFTHIVFFPTPPGRENHVMFKAGNSILGPYQIADMATGMNAAVEALRHGEN